MLDPINITNFLTPNHGKGAIGASGHEYLDRPVTNYPYLETQYSDSSGSDLAAKYLESSDDSAQLSDNDDSSDVDWLPPASPKKYNASLRGMPPVDRHTTLRTRGRGIERTEGGSYHRSMSGTMRNKVDVKKELENGLYGYEPPLSTNLMISAIDPLLLKQEQVSPKRAFAEIDSMYIPPPPVLLSHSPMRPPQMAEPVNYNARAREIGPKFTKFVVLTPDSYHAEMDYGRRTKRPRRTPTPMFRS